MRPEFAPFEILTSPSPANSLELISALNALFEVLLKLDLGVIGRRVLNPEDARPLLEEGMVLADRGFSRLVERDPSRARRWLSQSANMRGVKSVPLEAWMERVQSAPAAPRVDLATVEPSLRAAFEKLLAFAGKAPADHHFSPPAGEAAIDDRGVELGVRFPEELRTLFRFADGFTLCGECETTFQKSETRRQKSIAFLPLERVSVSPAEWGLGPDNLDILRVANPDGAISREGPEGQASWRFSWSGGGKNPYPSPPQLATSLAELLEKLLSRVTETGAFLGVELPAAPVKTKKSAKRTPPR